MTPVLPATVRGRWVAWATSAAPGGLPRWVRVVDVVTLVLACAAFSVDWFGPYRVRGFFSMASSLDAWVAAGMLLVGRHVLVTARPLPVRLGAACRRGLRSEAVRVFVLTRVPPLVVGYLAVSAFGFPAGLPYRLGDSPLGNLLARWDSGW